MSSSKCECCSYFLSWKILGNPGNVWDGQIFASSLICSTSRIAARFWAQIWAYFLGFNGFGAIAWARFWLGFGFWSGSISAQVDFGSAGFLTWLDFCRGLNCSTLRMSAWFLSVFLALILGFNGFGRLSARADCRMLKKTLSTSPEFLGGFKLADIVLTGFYRKAWF